MTASAAVSAQLSAALSTGSAASAGASSVDAVATEQAELIRALGVAVLTPPPGSDAVLDALGLAPFTGVEYTQAFVLLAPPHAAIHLGAEGKLGGEAADRVAGFWRALGLVPPGDADQLGALLLGLAELLDAAGRDAALARLAVTFLHEHVWSWAPGYLDALGRIASPAVAAWCELTLDVLRAQRAGHPEPPLLPLALRAAPPPVDEQVSMDDLLDAMVAPVRTGVVLTQADVADGARRIGVGFRRGERRYALKAMIEQDKPATLRWFAGHAAAAADRHVAAYGATDTGRWWTARAQRTAEVVDLLADAAGGA